MAAAGLGAGLLAARSGVPLYDGLGFPDAPYRFAGQTPPPSSATLTVEVRSGRSAGGIATTSEKGPQLVLQLDSAPVTTAADSLTVSASPLSPDGQPPTGSFDGNMYRLAVSDDPAGSGAVQVGSIQLRAAVMTRPAPRMLFRPRPTAGWQELRTSASGRDILQASLRGVGDYTLERPPGSKPISLGQSNGYLPALLGMAAIGTFLVASALLRRRHSNGDDDDWDPRPR